MSIKLPSSIFAWMNDNELCDWENIACILEVDLEYPQELHDMHNDFPLCAERLIVNKVKKLIPNLHN